MINFLEVERSVRALKRQYAAGQLDRATFEARLMELIDSAEDGYYWMFGHQTETWYRHDGVKWVPDNPGELITTTSSNPDNLSETANESPPDWRSLDWGWFLSSLVLLGLIGWIVYTSV
jgi:hypothetical protein